MRIPLIATGLLLVSLFASAQQENKFTIKALNRQIINRKDTIYRFYAISPASPVDVRNYRVYHWYKADTILATMGGYDGRLLDGEYKVFYPGKNLKEEGMFHNGLREGEWKYWQPDGRLSGVFHWKKGVRKGAFEEYDDSGRKVRQGYYVNDRLSGKVTVYGPGAGVHRVRYKNGEPVSEKPKKKGKKKTEQAGDEKKKT
ncbi:MAG TPA: hypothetical protein VHC96_23345 [Puia sp.]|jgi:hypothetical protein|nr:hypothetical protein [Puia sp.]